MLIDSLLNVTKKSGKQTLVDCVYRINSFLHAFPIAIVCLESQVSTINTGMHANHIFRCKPTEEEIKQRFSQKQDVFILATSKPQLNHLVTELINLGFKVIHLVESVDFSSSSNNYRQACINDLTSPFFCDDILCWSNREVLGRCFFYFNENKTNKKYSFCLGLIIRNSADRMTEWIEHYLSEGVDHFYIVNHLSTDNYKKVLKPFAEYITLWKTNRCLKHIGGNVFHPYMYNNGKKSHLQRYINSAIYEYASRQTRWITILDHDEFLWSSSSDLFSTVENLSNNKPVVYVPWRTIYGKEIERSSSVVYSCVTRFRQDRFEAGKSIINTVLPIQGLWHIHVPNMINQSQVQHLDANDENLGLNHYRFPSAKTLKDKQSVSGMYGKAYKEFGATIEDIHANSTGELADTKLLDMHRIRGIPCRTINPPVPITQGNAPLGNAIFRREKL